ncbi:TIGR01459 family HAD-type hydrolase [Pseudomonas aeruginosa]|nr:TIGR01459 family HAD-type hydrolase [Pseudomonas aeruginosa]MCS8237410.1 TIGR01459 family HAD-type hydrolase [Pseudomonas aeruginosa]MCT0307536.1 TIGR01459 family HAD-type hydrolase [Pseudomonas aeruginosa]MCT0348250.1 TIGR01459 family HAD-type hydrolase [Pseudomonas aeruginosa]MCT1230437.1 TIGR01459 family HAD-type hydrolase [Pseudomonas aeruginosa]
MSDAPTSPRFSAATSTRLLDHAQLEALCADYDGFLLDLWGVVMDGAEAFPGALAWLARRHAEGRPVWFLSNSSSSVVEMSAGLERLGIRRDWFAGITTSGQLTIDALLQTAEYRRGGIYLAGVGLAQQSWPAEIRERFVDDIAQAALIVGVGSFPQEELEQRFAPLRGATDLPFLCANPDRVVVSGGRTVYGAGMLAELFSEEGGQVSWYGKPDPAAFRIAQRQLEARGARHILFVGDSLVTDVPGALAARIDTLWLGATGIHREALGAEFNGALEEERVRSLLHGYPIRPHFAAPGLV